MRTLKISLVVASLFLCFVPMAAQSGGPDSTKLGTVERDLTYCVANGVPLKLDAHYPAEASGPLPVAMYVHGGGWHGGDKKGGAGSLDFEELLSRGYLVISVNYRLAPRYVFPAMIEDVKCAVRHLRATADRYGLDPERIGVWGSSAGGHLVSLLGVADESAGFEGTGGYPDQSSRVQAVVEMFGPADLSVMFSGSTRTTLTTAFGATSADDEILKLASPVTWISPDDPPFLLLHGEKDRLVPVEQSELLYEQLVEAGVPATFVVVKNAGHGFKPEGGAIQPTRQEISEMVGDFFDEHVKGQVAQTNLY